MKNLLSVLLVCLLVCLLTFSVYATEDGSQQFYELGDFKLESGDIIQDCRIGYRTFGKLNEDKSNAVLVPTWFIGKTEDFISNKIIAPGSLINSSKYFVIAVDALGNGDLPPSYRSSF